MRLATWWGCCRAANCFRRWRWVFDTDSVPGGGKYDGALGVVGAWLACGRCVNCLWCCAIRCW
jgi:hypothetical protein